MKKWVWMVMLVCSVFLFACEKDISEAVDEAASTPAVTPQETATPLPTPAQTPDAMLPTGASMEFTFSSGAGAWRTWLTLEEDGAFTGEYSDSNAGESGEGYLATVYICPFAGRFTDIQRINEYSYSMTLADITPQMEPGKEWIEEEVRYVASEPYGLAEGKAFTLYTPDTPLDALSEEFLSWWPGRWDSSMQNAETLGFYSIYNQITEQGFFSIE